MPAFDVSFAHGLLLPEPGSIALFAIGVIAVWFVVRRRRRPPHDDD